MLRRAAALAACLAAVAASPHPAPPKTVVQVLASARTAPRGVLFFDDVAPARHVRPPPDPGASAPVPVKSPAQVASPEHAGTHVARVSAARPAARLIAVSSSRLHHGYPTAVACVDWTENGGSYGRSSNLEHFGRYQFDRPTWVAFGGDPATWGFASPAEQDAVFARAVAAGGLWQGWLRWDGC
jgi:hypothetical protein